METTSRVYHWHGQFIVYVLKNKDVLLLSPGQQLLLPQAQFPFVDEFDGNCTVEDILKSKNELDEKSPLFLYQVNKLVELNLIQDETDNSIYIKPTFKSEVKHLTLELAELKQSFYVLSECDQKLVNSLFTWLSQNQAIQEILRKCAPLSIILVDDFLDGRVHTYLEGSDVLLLKITGDAVSVSPIFKQDEANLLKCLQWQLRENQPVRKALESHFSDITHAYPFELRDTLSSKQSVALETLLLSQLGESRGKKQISLYREATDKFEHHQVNLALDNEQVFAEQINAPVKLEPCISHFNIDGGSRNVTAEHTVAKLLPLISPITGVINHLEVIGENPKSPIKIYRTGFFKHHNKPDILEFDRNSFVQICLGKGVSHAQSKASALSEAVERYAALFQGDVDQIQMTQSQMRLQGYRTYDFQALVPYSQEQYRKFNLSSHPDSKLKQAAKPYIDQELRWLPTWSLTQSEQVYVPLSQCFSNIPFNDDEFGRWHSNGCAAGNTLEEAILQALFELIERDATAIWWYNRLSCAIFDLARINPDNLAKLDACLSPDEENGHDYWVLDITSDLGVPVMGAIGQDKRTGGLVMGFGCHLIPEMAAQRALTELCQLIPIRDQNAAPFDFDEIVKSNYLFGTDSIAPMPYVIEPSSDIKEDIFAIVERLKSMAMEVLVLNYSRAHIPLNTAKVFVPGLCHIWPQFANERLYQAPVRMGCLEEANNEESINPQDLYI